MADLRTSPMEKIRIRLAAEGYSSQVDGDEDDCDQYYSDAAYKKQKAGETHLEKILGVLLVISFIIIVALSALLTVQILYPVNKYGGTCQSPECVVVAGNVLQYMNLTVDPCEDFYTHACGGWEKNSIPPADRGKWSAFAIISSKNDARLKRILDEPGYMYKGVNSSAIRKAKDYYNACMNLTDMEVDKTPRVLELIRSLGGFPDLPATWSASTWDLTQALTEAHRVKTYPLFSMSVTTDDMNSTLQVISFDQSGLTLNDQRQYTGNDTDKFKKAFTKYYSHTVKLLGADKAVAERTAEDLWEFESKLAALMDDPVMRTDPRLTYHKMKLSEAVSLFGNQIDIHKYLDSMFGESIPASEDVLVYSPHFIGNMSKLVESTSKETLASYVTWHGTKMILDYMSTKFRQVVQDYDAAMRGVSAPPAVWALCVGRVNDALGFASGGLFIESYFTETDKNIVTEVIDAVKNAFMAQLPSEEWMDKETQIKALQKADAVKQKIGYPEFITKPAKLDKYYENFDVDTDSLGNYLNAIQFYKQKNLKKRGKPTDKEEWDLVPAEANAYFSITSNEIVFPGGILQSPIYDPTYPMALKFGIVGMIMGHELTHGFDNSGRLFDIEGNLKSWWTDESAEQFNKQAECLSEQYSKYTFYDQHVNGKTTLAENIADNGGTKVAYAAYQKWLQQTGMSESTARLPGLNMTENQLFFVGFAQLWCSYYTPEYGRQSILTDEHSPGKVRVLGTLSNMEEFSNAYECSAGSTMNPDKKCSLW